MLYLHFIYLLLTEKLPIQVGKSPKVLKIYFFLLEQRKIASKIGYSLFDFSESYFHIIKSCINDMKHQTLLTHLRSSLSHQID